MKRSNGILIVAAFAIQAAAAAPECMQPTQIPSLQVGKSEVCWAEIHGAKGYDAVVGLSLSSFATDGATLFAAQRSCLDAPRTANCVSVPFDPPPGDGFWIVVRAYRGNGNGNGHGGGTFETGCATERPGRDLELAGTSSCP